MSRLYTKTLLLTLFIGLLSSRGVSLNGCEPRGEEAAETSAKLPLDRWTYLQVDTSRQRRAFGLAFADLTDDRYPDIVSGQYFYRNPGGDLTAEWRRAAFPKQVDALFCLDVDGDAFGDVIALAPTGELYWLEAEQPTAETWRSTRVGSVGKTDHGISSQGYVQGQVSQGGRPEIVINVGRVLLFEIPPEPSTLWTRHTIAERADPEGIALGDIDADGDLDLIGPLENDRLGWWENPGQFSMPWTPHRVGDLPDENADRVYAVDLTGDKRLEVVVSAANGGRDGIYWWGQPADPRSPWVRHTVAQQGTTNSMDVADMDGDGDIDLVSGEHRGLERVSVWENQGGGRFTEHVISSGRESHLGTRVCDLDGDGDLDLVSIAWDDYGYLHIWRNDAAQP